MNTIKHQATQWNKRKAPVKDMHLNVGPREAIVRLILGLIIGGLVFFFDGLLLTIVTIIVSFYFVLTSFTLFCVLKYIWRHKIVHKADPATEDPEVPIHKL